LKAALTLKQDGTRGYGLVSSSAIKVFPDGRVEALGGAIHCFAHNGNRVERLPDLLPHTIG
jgi:hypothetical protein